MGVVINDSLRFGVHRRWERPGQQRYTNTRQVPTVYLTPAGFESVWGRPGAVPSGSYLVVRASAPPELVWRLWPLISHVVKKASSRLRLSAYLIPEHQRRAVERVVAKYDADRCQSPDV